MTDLVVLDSGAVERVESSKILRGILRRLVEVGADVVIPTVVLAEAVTGRATDAVVNRVVADAIVAAHAVLGAASTVLVTTDMDDPTALVSAHGHVRVVRA